MSKETAEQRELRNSIETIRKYKVFNTIAEVVNNSVKIIFYEENSTKVKQFVLCNSEESIRETLENTEYETYITEITSSFINTDNNTKNYINKEFIIKTIERQEIYDVWPGK